MSEIPSDKTLTEIFVSLVVYRMLDGERKEKLAEGFPHNPLKGSRFNVHFAGITWTYNSDLEEIIIQNRSLEI